MSTILKFKEIQTLSTESVSEVGFTRFHFVSKSVPILFLIPLHHVAYIRRFYCCW